MAEDANAWLANSDAMNLFRETRDYTLLQMEFLESTFFPRLDSHSNAPLAALRHNLRGIRDELENQKIRRIASNGFLLMGFSAFEYSLSQVLQCFHGANSRPHHELSFSQSREFLGGSSRRHILKTEQWRLLQSIQEIRHAVAHRGSIINLADQKFEPVLRHFAQVVAQPLFEDGDLRRSKEHSKAELEAIASRPSYLILKKADLELMFNFSESILKKLVASKPEVV